MDKKPPPAIVLAPLENVTLPPLRLFQYVEMVDDIKAITVSEPQYSESTRPRARETKRANGKSASSWTTPRKKAKKTMESLSPEGEAVVSAAEEDEECDADEDDDEEHDGEDNIDDVLGDIDDAEDDKAKTKSGGKTKAKAKPQPKNKK